MGGVFGAQNAPLWLQSGQQEAPPRRPGAHLYEGVKNMRPTGIGESIANALIPQRDGQGMPQAPGARDFISAALMALPGANAARAPKAAPKAVVVPEKISSAAITLKDGRVFTGTTHGEAFNSATESLGISGNDLLKILESDSKFITSEGRVVSRSDAGKIASNNQQFKNIRSGGYTKAEDMNFEPAGQQ